MPKRVRGRSRRGGRGDERGVRGGGRRGGGQKEDSMSCAMTTNSKVPLSYFYFRRFHNFISL